VDEAGLDTIDIVKIDVERAEGVVKGAERILRKAKALLIEIWPENSWVFGYLRSLNYELVMTVNHGIYRNYLLVRS
jgi:hypothetical protein